jgi:chromosomal replication initiation ATPase DnaA
MTVYQLETIRHLNTANGYRSYADLFTTLEGALKALDGWRSLSADRITIDRDQEVFFNPSQDEEADVAFIVRRVTEVYVGE